ncbi:ABC transporter ATP-binding protein, partial [Streptomyces sp. MB09-02B]|nr:ABC transporter ATP-binding protein [Streptomyces sp. MB09-02B]
ASAGASVVVEGRGAPGAQVPSGVRDLVSAVEDSGAGSHLFTVPADRSDSLLRALLEARPPWHVVRVTPVTEQTDMPTAAAAPGDPEDEPTTELEVESSR